MSQTTHRTSPDRTSPDQAAPDRTSADQAAAGHVVTDVADATRRLIGLLDADQRDHAVRAVTDDALRHRWEYAPGTRPGLVLGELRRDQRKAVHGMLAAVLSPHAYAQAAAVMALEDVLDSREGGHRDRHSGDFWTMLFGTPDGDEPWGWRIEGHHLSVNVLVADGRISATPFFLGANPARVTYRGRVVSQPMQLEEELARELLDRMDPAARGLAVVSDLTPHDIRSGNSPRIDPAEPVGVTPAQLGRRARELLVDIVRLYLDRLRHELAYKEFARIDQERLHFSWEGSQRRGDGHYYRIQGPGVLIEYDNTFNEANHIHSVWRRHSADFGDDLLAALCNGSRHTVAG
ncbi:DUF3500 domain-containing protein [Streptomyces sp. HNM0575]|uniref:DUF3500 domain-containing protein n=1 Tax=Streptomyces sp. HNM0575 TaxID=2716338 RepID=UPI00145E5E87|nr:DUF3500 domain-containing protein [Streptomyces sp. HNM0575]NLU74405.1 DUF3500 domain-containing protein [Streptomyces sp. HNM0575]